MSMIWLGSDVGPSGGRSSLSLQEPLGGPQTSTRPEAWVLGPEEMTIFS